MVCVENFQEENSIVHTGCLKIDYSSCIIMTLNSATLTPTPIRSHNRWSILNSILSLLFHINYTGLTRDLTG
jgi:hypothetical protein